MQGSDYQRGRDGQWGKSLKWVKWINCMVTDGKQIFGGEHVVGYTEVGI